MKLKYEAFIKLHADGQPDDFIMCDIDKNLQGPEMYLTVSRPLTETSCKLRLPLKLQVSFDVTG